MRCRTLLILVIIISGFFLYRWGWVENPAQFVARYQDTGLNSHFSAENYQDFSDYVKKSVAMIHAARVKNKVDATEITITENSPAALFPTSPQCKLKNGKYDKGIVLVHGLLDSPYPYNWLEKHFQEKCFVVYKVLLSGHGTTPGDLLHVKYQDWAAVTHFAVMELQKKVNTVYLAGYSLGGLLAINEALDNPNIKALILFAPSMKLASSLQPYIPLIYLSNLFIPRMQWWVYHSDNIQVRYESIPVNPVYQLIKLLHEVSNKLQHHSIELPIFVMQSEQDSTVDALATAKLFSQNHHEKSRLIWYSQFGTMPEMSDARILMVKSIMPKQNVISMTHVSLFLPSTDKIYGLDGYYHDCLAYPEYSPVWMQCKTGKDNVKGETTPNNMKFSVLQRLTYNPFNQEFAQKLDLFLRSIK